MIEGCTSVKQQGWLSLREQLWSDCSREEHLAQMSSFLADPSRYVQFVAYDDDGSPVGFAEASLRIDYVNGSSSSPVAFLEGIYVVSHRRRQGIAARLVAAVTEWAVSCGCQELASDALLDNGLSQIFHQSLGFRETERVVFFCKSLF
ncbi:MAG: aminoglycoside 6'-N-acetyltransferase [Cyanobacteria bacterium P01_G01_bin.38]